MMRWRDLGFLAAGAALAVAGISRVSAQPIVVSAPGSAVRASTTTAAVPPAPASVPEAAQGAVSLTRLNDTTMVSVKDHGDSQTVLVFTFDDQGVMKPTPQKLRFYYK